MHRLVQIACLAACLFSLPVLAADSSSSASSTSDNASSSSFQTGSKIANSGDGYSMYSTFVSSKYRVECNCADFSLDTKICSSTTYQCNCTPKAVLSCQ